MVAKVSRMVAAERCRFWISVALIGTLTGWISPSLLTRLGTDRAMPDTP